jgi:hypothetical protein
VVLTNFPRIPEIGFLNSKFFILDYFGGIGRNLSLKDILQIKRLTYMVKLVKNMELFKTNALQVGCRVVLCSIFLSERGVL